MVEFEFKAYRRSFAQDYHTASDSMLKREGVLIRLRGKDGRFGYGEAAPIVSFGSESFVSALTMCAQIAGKIEYERLHGQLADFPCLRFGVESALAMIDREQPCPELSKPWKVCGLVSELNDSEAIERRIKEGYQCLKLKIGKRSFAEERRCLEQIVERTGGSSRLRLDANGGLDLKASKDWLESVEGLPVEFIEQPMAQGEEATMLALANDYPIPIALDESVVRVDDLKRWKDRHWPGVFVVKPSLSGAFGPLIEELKMYGQGSLVYSSSLETKIGTANALSVAILVGQSDRALGFGVNALFADDGISVDMGSQLDAEGLPSMEDFEELWSRI